jgi:hypothetical protein
MAADSATILCIASRFTGDRFLTRCKQDGCNVLLLTSEKFLHEPWSRQAIDEVFALPHFQDRRLIVSAVSYLARTRPIRRIVALDDPDAEIAAHLREHLRLPGLGESAARLFRDKLAMRSRARELDVRVPEFVGIVHHAEVRHFLSTVPGPWLLKPRGYAGPAGVRKLLQPDEVWRALEKLGDDQSFHLLERQVPGELYHVDSLTADGRVVFAEVSKYLRPPAELEPGAPLASRTVGRDRPEVAALCEINTKLLTGFGLPRGASHTEFMKAHSDGEYYFIETSARVGGMHTAEMVEAATGVNLWSEWARLECKPEEAYEPPAAGARYGGVVTGSTKQEKPDTSGYTDAEIVARVGGPNCVGFVVAADEPERVEKLLTDYGERIRRDFAAPS